MNTEETRAQKMQKDREQCCSCPFCEEPICPDPGDDQYRCKNDGALKIHRVDCVGLYCPLPVMRAKEEIDLLQDGALMELIADDPASAEDIPRWAKRAGHRFLGMRKDGEEYRYLVQKAEN